MQPSTANPLSGAATLQVRLGERANPDTACDVRKVVQAFVRAIEQGFFDIPGFAPAMASAAVEHLSSDTSLLWYTFHVERVAPTAFERLAGMFLGRAIHLGLEAQLEMFYLDSVPLCGVSSEHDSSIHSHLPFQLLLPEDAVTHNSLRIWMDFFDTIPDEGKCGLLELFDTWSEIVLGAFPAEGRPPGDSWAVSTLCSFLLPTRIEFAVDDFEASDEALICLLSAILRIHHRMSVASVEIE